MKTFNGYFFYLIMLFLTNLKPQNMSEQDKIEIIRDNRVARLLWFILGFMCAVVVTYLSMKHHS